MLPIAALLSPALLAFALALAPAGAARAAEPVFPPASRVGLVPPPGFVTAKNFTGFEHTDKQASILVADLPGYAFEAIAKQVAEQLEADPTAARRREIQLADGGHGFVLAGRQAGPQGPILKRTLVALDRDTTAIVTALVPESVEDALPEEALEKAFASVTVRERVPAEEQLSVLPFSMQKLAGMRIIRVQPGVAAMLTDGASDAVELAEQSLLMVSLAPAKAVPAPEERDGLARRLLGDLPGIKDMRVTRAEPLRVAGQQGYEVMVTGKDSKTGGEVEAVQWLRFGPTSLLRIVGLARKDAWDDAYRRFREVRDGIGLR